MFVFNPEYFTVTEWETCFFIDCQLYLSLTLIKANSNTESVVFIKIFLMRRYDMNESLFLSLWAVGTNQKLSSSGCKSIYKYTYCSNTYSVFRIVNKMLCYVQHKWKQGILKLLFTYLKSYDFQLTAWKIVINFFEKTFIVTFFVYREMLEIIKLSCFQLGNNGI